MPYEAIESVRRASAWDVQRRTLAPSLPSFPLATWSAVRAAALPIAHFWPQSAKARAPAHVNGTPAKPKHSRVLYPRAVPWNARLCMTRALDPRRSWHGHEHSSHREGPQHDVYGCGTTRSHRFASRGVRVQHTTPHQGTDGACARWGSPIPGHLPLRTPCSTAAAASPAQHSQ